VKKTKRLGIKKVTLRNLDEPTLDTMAGGIPKTFTSCPPVCVTICAPHTCVRC
jgi:hypothetical protein